MMKHLATGTPADKSLTRMAARLELRNSSTIGDAAIEEVKSADATTSLAPRPSFCASESEGILDEITDRSATI